MKKVRGILGFFSCGISSITTSYVASFSPSLGHMAAPCYICGEPSHSIASIPIVGSSSTSSLNSARRTRAYCALHLLSTSAGRHPSPSPAGTPPPLVWTHEAVPGACPDRPPPDAQRAFATAYTELQSELMKLAASQSIASSLSSSTSSRPGHVVSQRLVGSGSSSSSSRPPQKEKPDLLGSLLGPRAPPPGAGGRDVKPNHEWTAPIQTAALHPMARGGL